jgi:hypothetical protein
MATTYVLRSFGSVVLINTTPQPLQYINVTWVTRDGKASWVTRDGKVTWKTRS